MPKLLRAAVLALLSLSTLASSASWAEDWPTRPVRLIIPFPAGGGTDIIARVLAAKLEERLKQSFIVENVPGAGGLIGTQKVAASPPDGYTFVIGITNTFAINPTFYKHLSYDPVKDFQPVSLLAVGPHVVVINPKTPANTMLEYIAYVKKNPGKLSYASYGSGSTSQLITELLKQQEGLDLIHVPYKGIPPALADVMGDRISVLVSSTAPAIPLIRSGQLRALAIYGDKRIASLPDVPTMLELGFKDSALYIWYGLFAPAGTPRSIVEKMNAELQAIMSDKDVADAYLRGGIYTSPMSVDEFTAFVKAEVVRWGKLVTLSGAKAE
jgi:tripartite-type tricarboxylate transporter receptor subunit TctC